MGSYTAEKQISVTVEHGSNAGVPEDFLRINVWQAGPVRGWTFFRYRDLNADPNYLAKSALYNAERVAQGKQPVGGMYVEPVRCASCGQVVCR